MPDPARYLADVVRFAATAALAAAAGVAVLAAPIPTARAASGKQTISELNAQRARNGLPAAITENASWSRGCAAHDHYMAVNHTLAHSEDPRKPGYTAGGAFAGENAVLIEGAIWDHGDPYESAPLHLDQLLAPRLNTTGSADEDAYSCTITWAGMTGPEPAAPTVYTYPGDRTTIYASEAAREQPWTPGDLIGIRQPARTGPYLIVLVDAPGQSPIDNPTILSDATLTGQSGPVPVETVDGHTAVPSGATPTLGAYISPGGFILPAHPLLVGVTYRAHVVVTFAGMRIAHQWSFTTRGADPQSTLTAHGSELSFSSSSPARIEVSFTRAGGEHAHGLTIGPGHSARLRLEPGRWWVCGHQPAAASFASYARCTSILVTGEPSMRIGGPRVTGRHVSFELRYSAVLRGRKATLTITPLTAHCAGARRCKIIAGKPWRHKLLLRVNALTLTLPAPGHGFRLALTTTAFHLRDAPWTAARASSRFVRR